jgi:cytochrome P450/NADPH-cytochrome P450 reductase
MTGMTARQGPRSADEIPGPKGFPVVGNMFDIPAGRTMQTLMDLTRQYGPMLRLRTPFGDRFIVSGLEEIDQLCDDTRFDKFVGVAQRIIRELRPSAGLFTADTDDPDWQKAHNILLPNFSQQAMQGYLPMMIDIAAQLMQKWERLNPGEPVDVTADMTRLTLDTIALCGFGYRFNSFYREDQHPFVEAMLGVLTESQTQARQLRVQRTLRRRAARQMNENYKYMEGVVGQIITERRKAGDAADHQDLLSCMLEGVDKRTGQKLSDGNIIAQCNTFLVAGHETTSGLLSFAVSYLLKAPDVVVKANEEVDRVLGTDLAVTPTYQQVQGLTYVTQILNEILRLWPTAPAFTRYPYEDTVLGGYGIPKGTSLTALTPMLHRLPEIWGADAEEFNPDHFRPETRAALPPNAFRPFGAGQRACIGRQFAMQEAVLVLGMLLQRFEFVDSFDYTLKIKEALTLKPEDLRITLRPRLGRTTGTTPAAPQVTGGSTTSDRPAPRLLPVADRHNTPLTVLFGSNLGTAEGIATRIAQDGTERGFAVTLGSLDDHTGELPHAGALVVVCASYNGQPPDNAERFCRWIQAPGTAADAADGLAFTVFGCGNMDWASTYQAVPTLIDSQLEARGGRRVHARGEGDARSDFDGQYQQWYAQLWPSLNDALGLSEETAGAAAAKERLHVSMTNRQTTNPLVMSYRAAPATVLVNRELNGDGTSAPERSTRHVEIALPPGLEYATGDHLGVLPRNGFGIIRRVITKFGLDAGTYLTITQAGGSYTHLPVDEPAPLLGILGSCVELQDVATRSDIAVLAQYTADPVQRDELLGLSTLDDEGRARYRKRVASRRVTLLDLLDDYPSCDLPFNVYLDLLPALRPRYYSISSSPAVTKSCDITVGVLSGPARSGDGTFTGVCSGHIDQSGSESTVFVFVRKPRIPFRPPENPHLPMIMVGAGTGMAPFRGFLQERAAMKEQGVPVAASMLFFGCRTPDIDFLYADELRGFEAAGVTQLCTAFSRVEGEGPKYVQHAIDAERDQVWDLLEQGAVVYVCGNATTMAPGVRAALTEVYRAKTGGSEADGEKWLADLRTADRYLEDIWGETAAGSVM